MHDTQDVTAKQPPDVIVTATSVIAAAPPTPHWSWTVMGYLILALFAYLTVSGWGGVFGLPVNTLSWKDMLLGLFLMVLTIAGLQGAPRRLAVFATLVSYALLILQFILFLQREVAPMTHLIHVLVNIGLALVLHGSWSSGPLESGKGE